MIGHASEIEAGATLETDLCIIGSGPAGMAVAAHFEGKGASVLLLESGGFDPEPAIQALYQGELIGRPYFPLDACRMRYLGGSSNCWAGLCRPLDPEDFEARPWVPHSGWPFGRAELDPWYAAAERFLGLKGEGWDLARWAGTTAQKPWNFKDKRVQSAFFKLSAPIHLGQTRRPALTASSTVRVVLGASVVRLGLDAAGGRLERLEVRRSTGEGGFTVRPRRVVLACGGIENARLLLASDDVHRTGVGNLNDRVGRYFMEHPHTDGEGLLLGAPGAGFYHRHPVRGQPIWGCFMLSAATRAAEGLMSAALVLLPRPGKPDALEEAVRLAVADTDAPGKPVPDAATVYSFGAPSEQAPDPDSRVLLGGERDRLGMRRVRLDWRVSTADQRSLARTQEILAEALAGSGLGRIKLTLRAGQPFPTATNGGRHHMGTTRMHADPRQGVVDAQGKVHGVANLYVAGSSLFPTSGSANPTLTLTALALRLAAHLEATP